MQKVFAGIVSTVALLIPVSLVFADTEVSATTLRNPLQYNSLPALLTGILDVVITIATPILVLFIVYIGFKFVAAQGNPEKIKEARKFLLWALVGALIILGAKALAIAIQATVIQIQG